MDKIKPLLKKESFEIKSLFPPELEFEYQNYKVKLKYIKGCRYYDLILSIPEKNIEVEFSQGSSNVAKKSLKIAQHKTLELERYLRLISTFPRRIHEEVLRATAKAPSASIPVLQFLNALYQKDYIWRDDVLWIVGKGDVLLAVKPEKKRKAKTAAAPLTSYAGRKTLKNSVLNGVDVNNFPRSWGLEVVSFATFETAADTLKRKGHGDIAEAIRCAASYVSRDTRGRWLRRLGHGLSEKELQELKEKSEKVLKRRKREERYHALYKKFVKRRYHYLPDKNELLLFPKCRILFGIDTEAQKIDSENYQYHIPSRINTGKWPPSVMFRPRSKFYGREIEELRKSVKEAIKGIPQVHADKLRAYFVDWILET